MPLDLSKEVGEAILEEMKKVLPEETPEVDPAVFERFDAVVAELKEIIAKLSK